MDVSTKIYQPCLCNKTESCNCELEVSIALARINTRDFQPRHFSYKHKGKHNEVEVTPTLLIDFGDVDIIFVNHSS